MGQEKEAKQRKKPEPTPLSQLPLKHRFMFNKVFQQKDILLRFLEKALQIEIEKIEFVEAEKTIETNYLLRSVRLDIYVKDSKQIINVEMQTRNRGPLEKRARWYEASIDRSLASGASFKALRPLYVIFVCDYDMFKDPELNGFACYTREELWKQNGASAEDDYHLIVFNSKYRKDAAHMNADPEILELLDFIRTNDSNVEYETELAKMSVEAVNKVRNDSGLEEEYMSFVEYVMDEREDAFNEGADQLKECLKCVCMGYTDAQIAAELGENQEDVQAMIDKARSLWEEVQTMQALAGS